MTRTVPQYLSRLRLAVSEDNKTAPAASIDDVVQDLHSVRPPCGRKADQRDEYAGYP